MRAGDRVKAGADCRIAPEEAYVEAWINEGEEGTILGSEDYIEFAEARPVKVGSPAETTLRSGKNKPHEKRRFTRLLVKFDCGITVKVDSDKVINQS